ncbi:uncharacterized protein IWZ02DRAFT_163095 [Phyllosticta citriasiana]
MNMSRLPSPSPSPSEMSSNGGDSEGEGPTDDEIETRLRRAESEHRRWLPRFFKQHAYKIGFLIMGLMAIIIMQRKLLQQEAQPPIVDPTAIINHQHASPDQEATAASGHLKNINNTITPRQVDDLVSLADQVVSFARAGALASTDMPLIGLDVLMDTSLIVKTANRSTNVVWLAAKSIDAQLHDILGTVRADAEVVPHDAAKAVMHLNQTVGRIRIRLDAVVAGADFIVPIITRQCENLKLLTDVLTKGSQHLESDVARTDQSLVSKLSKVIWMPYWLSSVVRHLQQAREEMARMRELCTKLEPTIQLLCDSVRPLTTYANVLRKVPRDLCKETVKLDSRWTVMADLETWAGEHDLREKVAPCVVQNYLELLRMLERIQLREVGGAGLHD